MPIFPTELNNEELMKSGAAIVSVRMGDRGYPIVIQPGGLAQIGETTATYCCPDSKPIGRTVAIITNPKIAALYAGRTGVGSRV